MQLTIAVKYFTQFFLTGIKATIFYNTSVAVFPFCVFLANGGDDIKMSSNLTGTH